VSFDLVVLVLVVIFALFGAASGFARQVGQAAAAVTAFIGAGPAGRRFGDFAAAQLSASLTVGVVVATVASFVLIYLAVRSLLTLTIRRLLAGDEPENRSRDRALGALLSATKAAGLTYLALCAATFLENNLVVAGKKFSVTPKGSVLVPLARRYNVLEYQQFAGAVPLAKLLKSLRDPQKAAALKNDPDLAALMKDSRFAGLTNQKALQQALETGDLHALLSSNQVVELLRDPNQLKRIERITEHD
jgi:membrane protein required for colicin V production